MDFLCNADVYCSGTDKSGKIVLVDEEKQQISVKFVGNEQIIKFVYPLAFQKGYLKALDDTISSRIAEDIQKAEDEKKKAAEEKQRQETEIANRIEEEKRAKREELGNKPAEYYNIKNYTELLLKERDQRLAGFKYDEGNSAHNRFLMLFKNEWKFYWENIPVYIHMEIHDNNDVHNVFLHMEVIYTATGDSAKDSDLENYLGDKYNDYVEFRDNVRNVFSNISRGRLGGLTVAMLYINGETCEEFLNSFLQKAEEVDELFGEIK